MRLKRIRKTEDRFWHTVADKYEMSLCWVRGQTCLQSNTKTDEETVAVKVLFPHMVLKPEIVQRFSKNSLSQRLSSNI